MTAPDADLTIQTLNVHATSDAKRVAGWLENQIRFHDVDMVALQELTGRHIRELERIDDYNLIVDRDEPGSGETGWLVKRKTLVTFNEAKRMTRDGWWGHQVNRQHTPRFMATMAIFKPHLPMGVVHTPPGVDCTDMGLTGPRDRRRAWRQYMRSLLKWARQRQRFILIGDWNERAAVKSRWSPRWLAKKVGARVSGTGTLDFVMTKGMKVIATTRLETPVDVDHDSFIFYVDFK